VQALWLNHSDPTSRDKQYSATIAALIGIGPKDELEGMMAAQLIAAHIAALAYQYCLDIEPELASILPYEDASSWSGSPAAGGTPA
jgi:hypothetical protein